MDKNRASYPVANILWIELKLVSSCHFVDEVGTAYLVVTSWTKLGLTTQFLYWRPIPEGTSRTWPPKVFPTSRFATEGHTLVIELSLGSSQTCYYYSRSICYCKCIQVHLVSVPWYWSGNKESHNMCPLGMFLLRSIVTKYTLITICVNNTYTSKFF